MTKVKKLLLLLMVTGWLIACTTLIDEGQTLRFTQTPGPDLNALAVTTQMTTGRAAHTATRLPDGTVLVTGGFTSGEQALSSSEIYDPTIDSFVPAGTMQTARQSHSATLLPGGKVLLAGGYNGDYLATAELYDPAHGVFMPTGSMTEARSGHIAVRLANGKVLLVGGTGVGWRFLQSAELYDPASGQFSPTAGDMAVARESHTATLLQDGTVLITGGHQGRRSDITIFDSAELYDPVDNAFTAIGAMTVKRHKHDATLLADGRVLISGGADERDAQGAYRSAEIYEPLARSFRTTASMHVARYKHTDTSLLLPNGQVLLVGGADVVELYDPETERFYQVIDSLGEIRLFARATLLSDGRVLFTGGYGHDIASNRRAWILNF